MGRKGLEGYKTYCNFVDPECQKMWMKGVKNFLQMSYEVLHSAIIIIIKLELRNNECCKAACVANLRDGSNFRGRERHGLHLRPSWALNGLDGLKFQIWPQNWNQDPQLPWYPCAFYLQQPFWCPLRPWQPTNDLRGQGWLQNWTQWRQLPMLQCFGSCDHVWHVTQAICLVLIKAWSFIDVDIS